MNMWRSIKVRIYGYVSLVFVIFFQKKSVLRATVTSDLLFIYFRINVFPFPLLRYFFHIFIHNSGWNMFILLWLPWNNRAIYLWLCFLLFYTICGLFKNCLNWTRIIMKKCLDIVKNGKIIYLTMMRNQFSDGKMR